MAIFFEKEHHYTDDNIKELYRLLINWRKIHAQYRQMLPDRETRATFFYTWHILDGESTVVADKLGCIYFLICWSLLIYYNCTILHTCIWNEFLIINHCHCRGEVGCWFAFVVVVLRLFFPRKFPGIISLSLFFVSSSLYSAPKKYAIFSYYSIGRLNCCMELTMILIICIRLARAARLSDSSHGRRPQPLCRQIQEQPHRHICMPDHRVLPAPRAHQRVRWLQGGLQKGQWRVKHHRHRPALRLPCLGLCAVCVVEHLPLSVWPFAGPVHYVVF